MNALGIVSALGSNCDQTRQRLFDSQVQSLTYTDKYDPGNVTPLGLVTSRLPSVTEIEQKHRSRNNQMLLAAFQQIKKEVSAAIAKYGKYRVAVVLGTSTSGIAETERSFEGANQWLEHYHYAQQDIGSPALSLAHYLGLKGITYTISTACSSSAKALASASRLLDMDMCDVVIAGGVDTLCALTVRGFAALDAISADICNPSSKNRDGINIGEGAALFLLSRDLPAAAKDTVCLSGIGESSDAHHISAPDPDGRGAYRAMELALQRASRGTDEIDYINLHGTATLQNDAMESKAIHDLFGKGILCSSTKPLTGHCLGASGAIEAGLCWLMLQQEDNRRVPVHRWDGQHDEEIADITLVDNNNCDVPDLRCLLSNSFAFGGSNITLLMERRSPNNPRV
jgi:3-oxoacyl-[acyl-carrier-protein] synthase-1